jgi:hypothetical protein
MFDSYNLEERLEILLALALAFSEKDNLVSGNLESNSFEIKTETICEMSKTILNSLPNDDFNKIINKLNFYKSWNLNEQNSWKFRILQRMQDRSFWLDKFIHHTHLSKVLQSEPLYIQLFILNHLPADISHPVAVSLGILPQLQEVTKPTKTKKNTKSNGLPSEELKTIVREKFLSNFIAFEDIFAPKPLDYLSGDEILNVIYQLGVNEIAFACCGINEIENLATFLRRFSEYTSQLIVNKLAKFNKIENDRISLAEAMIQEWWEKANNNTSALVGLIGFHKLARAMTLANSQEVTYLKQKLTVDLAEQFDDEFRSVQNKLDESFETEKPLTEIAKVELDEIAHQIFIESKGIESSIDLNIEEPIFEEIV